MELLSKTDSVAAFLDKHCDWWRSRHVVHTETSCDEAYEYYLDFCGFEKREPLSREAFGRKLKRHCPKVLHKRVRNGKGLLYVYVGLRLLDWGLAVHD